MLIHLDILALSQAAEAAASTAAEPSTLARLWGRLHVVVVHFPIALLTAAAFLQVLRWRATRPSPAALACLLLGSVGAVVAASMGWTNAELEGHGRSVQDTIFWHRWVGVATTVTALVTSLAALLFLKVQRARLRIVYRAGLLLGALLVTWGSHLGGTLVYGDGYLLEVFRTPAGRPAPPATNGGGQVGVEPGHAVDPGGTPVAVPAGGGVDYETEVRPIFEGACLECHGETRPQGRLRLDDLTFVFERPPAFWAIVPGDPDASPLVQRVELPPEHEDRMPAEGPPLSAAEVETIRAWIAEGARWNGGAPPAPGAAPAPAGGDPGAPEPEREAPRTGSAERAPAAAVEATLADLRAAGAIASPLAEGTRLVEVNLRHAPDAGDAELALLSGLEASLHTLNLGGTEVTDEGLARLADFGALRRLYLDNTSIGNEGLRHLAGLQGLEYLNLYGTRVGDPGLRHLEGLRGLRKLYLWQTAATAAGVARLRAALPELEAVLDG